MCHWFFGFPFLMGGFGWIWMFLGVIFIIGLIILLFSRKGFYGFSMYHSDHEHHKRDYDDPIEILKRMYARGEISEGEYEKRRKNLEK